MRVLVLGGTSFVGRAIVDDALRAGAEVTLFSRGRTGPGLFPGAGRLTGDRDTGDYTALHRGRWDAVVDVSGYVPRRVGQAKVACEDDVTARYGDRATIVRPGTVAGPHDPQDGLTYWVRRAGLRAGGRHRS